MTRLRLSVRLALLGLLVACAVQGLASQLYHMTELDFVPSGLSNSGWVSGRGVDGCYRWSQSTGLDRIDGVIWSNGANPKINDQGLVAGSRQVDGKQTGFFWTPSTGVVDFLGEHDHVSIGGLNNLGDVVGSFRDGELWTRFVRNANGVITQLPFFGFGLNDQGVAVGEGFVVTLGTPTAARGDCTAFSLMPLPDLTWDFHVNVHSINLSGTVCGYYNRNSTEWGTFRWNEDGSVDWFMENDYPWLHHLEVINDDGLMLGHGNHGTLLVNPDMTYLALNDSYDASSQGWQSNHAVLLNNQGQVAGYGRTPDGRVTGYLATPVAEPIPAISFVLATMLICFRRRTLSTSPQARSQEPDRTDSRC